MSEERNDLIKAKGVQKEGKRVDWMGGIRTLQGSVKALNRQSCSSSSDCGGRLCRPDTVRRDKVQSCSYSSTTPHRHQQEVLIWDWLHRGMSQCWR